MTTDKSEREAFERDHLGPHNTRRFADGDQRYVDPRVQIEWQLWQLAWKSARAVIAADRASRLPEITDEQIVSAMLAGSGGDPVWMRLTNKQMIAAGRAVEALVRGKT